MLDFRRGETPEWALAFYQDNARTLALDCTGGTLEVIATDLPFPPALAWDDRAGGRARLSISEAQGLSCTERRRYFVKLRYTSAGGQITIPHNLPILVEP
ncbi:MAG: hypothetical protein E6G92_04210 [Alphaproteobacteria bacterium]|nr:MAG: hypothetical protein E6G92_04210 [Alphaproteobacteria bacterium]